MAAKRYPYRVDAVREARPAAAPSAVRVLMRHPGIDCQIEVAASAVPHHERSGWLLASGPEPEQKQMETGTGESGTSQEGAPHVTA